MLSENQYAKTKMQKRKTRSPLKRAPLRVAGESIDAQLDEVIHSELLSPYILAAFMALLALMEWFRFYTEMKPNPWLFSVVAALAVAYAFFRMRRGYWIAKQLKLGRSGERAVAQYLERFRAKDFFVFHDVPSGDANIDHLLIGTKGIYTIETKTLSKPTRGDARIRVHDQSILADGHVIDRNPIVQAKAQAGWVYNFFTDCGFKKFVQPVVVFPGWYVEPCDMKSIGVWIIEPKALDSFIERRQETLTPDEVRAMASAVSSHITSQSAL
jgi:hypothetical protein